jgi:hypothetical protein
MCPSRDVVVIAYPMLGNTAVGVIRAVIFKLLILNIGLRGKKIRKVLFFWTC